MQNTFNMFNDRRILDLFNLFNPDITKSVIEWSNNLVKK
jgi:hypothetical protein